MENLIGPRTKEILIAPKHKSVAHHTLGGALESVQKVSGQVVIAAWQVLAEVNIPDRQTELSLTCAAADAYHRIGADLHIHSKLANGSKHVAVREKVSKEEWHEDAPPAHVEYDIAGGILIG